MSQAVFCPSELISTAKLFIVFKHKKKKILQTYYRVSEKLVDAKL